MDRRAGSGAVQGAVADIDHAAVLAGQRAAQNGRGGVDVDMGVGAVGQNQAGIGRPGVVDRGAAQHQPAIAAGGVARSQRAGVQHRNRGVDHQRGSQVGVDQRLVLEGPAAEDADRAGTADRAVQIIEDAAAAAVDPVAEIVGRDDAAGTAERDGPSANDQIGDVADRVELDHTLRVDRAFQVQCGVIVHLNGTAGADGYRSDRAIECANAGGLDQAAARGRQRAALDGDALQIDMRAGAVRLQPAAAGIIDDDAAREIEPAGVGRPQDALVGDGIAAVEGQRRRLVGVDHARCLVGHGKVAVDADLPGAGDRVVDIVQHRTAAQAIDAVRGAVGQRDGAAAGQTERAIDLQVGDVADRVQRHRAGVVEAAGQRQGGVVVGVQCAGVGSGIGAGVDRQVAVVVDDRAGSGGQTVDRVAGRHVHREPGADHHIVAGDRNRPGAPIGRGIEVVVRGPVGPGHGRRQRRLRRQRKSDRQRGQASAGQQNLPPFPGHRIRSERKRLSTPRLTQVKHGFRVYDILIDVASRKACLKIPSHYNHPFVTSTTARTATLPAKSFAIPITKQPIWKIK